MSAAEGTSHPSSNSPLGLRLRSSECGRSVALDQAKVWARRCQYVIDMVGEDLLLLKQIDLVRYCERVY